MMAILQKGKRPQVIFHTLKNQKSQENSAICRLENSKNCFQKKSFQTLLHQNHKHAVIF
jgi:hypothetical protein